MGGAGRFFWERLGEANINFMFCGLRYRSLRRLGGDLLLVQQKQNQTHQLWNEAQLNCVSLRSSLDYEVAWRPVKGEHERQKTAPLTALHATGGSVVDVATKIWRAAT